MNRLNLIAGFGFTGYRSFWSEQPQLIEATSKIHLLAGPNNSGKSNILRFAQAMFPDDSRHKTVLEWVSAGSLELPLGGVVKERPRVSLGVRKDIETGKQLLSYNPNATEPYVDAFVHLLSQPPFQRNGSDLAWFDFEVDTNGRLVLNASAELEAAKSGYTTLDESGHAVRMDLPQLFGISSLARRARGQYPVNGLLNSVDIPKYLPPVEMIDGLRHVRTNADGASSHSGENLIIKLAELQSPINQDATKLKKFAEINLFVQKVLDDTDATIHIPFTHDQILVRSKGRVLPLSHLGTGVEEVIILAAAATIIEDHLVCIEEPEVHLHPILQRRLIRHLNEHTNNRYLIATHSAHMLDTELASISQVAMGESGTEVAAAITPKDLSALSAKLGYRASDLVQSNCVIWVEGPSDRLYIRKWISLLNDKLIEGIHYVIMFYGGSVLSHLTTDDPAADAMKFISLRRLNRNMVVVMDSDMDKSTKPIGAAKLRVQDELATDDHSHTWITAGYTIENYIPVDLFTETMEALYPNAKTKWRGDRYQNPLKDSLHEGTPVTFSKADVAETVTERWQRHHDWPHDLKDQIQELVHFIQRANKLDE